ncbi:MAG: 1-deoxy-D-xylulose-5-phosphate synthase [Bacteroidetes bacterium]|nr:1-deoxy-D-xylulose-5-phosphate synthase [Bacteroidota bacterium]
MVAEPGKLLSLINYPSDLKKLDKDQLPQLCEELRRFIIDSVSYNPGHLGSSLGTVELTVALHYIFNTPYDKLIWDVGHQAYPHKILTGRKDIFNTNRMYQGISGFPKMSESEYDSFGVGHSSTSISAALGMAVASALKNENNRQHVAIIGDGSMTAGMSFEALNHAGVAKSNLLVILNDNGIAIDKNVGALSEYLTKITTSKSYNRFKEKIWYFMGGGSPYGKSSRAVVRQLGSAVKSTLLRKSNLFESLNFRYFGPVDGHDVIRLAKLLKDLKEIPGPKILHIITKKGKGLEKAEQDPIKYHAPGTFDRKTGEIIKTECTDRLAPKYQTVFGRTIIELAQANDKIIGITPAMPTGCSLNLMMEKMPDRAFDVGIAEQHAVTFSAGMAVQGMIPFCNIYSSFMQRAFDQVIHDVALQKLNVVFCLDRGGLVGEDGATHHGVFDLAYFRSIPNITIVSPLNEQELRNMMFTAQLENAGCYVIRYPRGRGVMFDWKTPFEKLQVGKAQVIREGNDIAIISIGHIGNSAIKAAELLIDENIEVAVYDMRFLKPIDEDMLHQIFKKHSKIITLEDGVIIGGLGSAVMEFAADHHYSNTAIKRLGVPDKFIEQGSIAELQAECGFDLNSIIKTIKEMLTK